MSSFIAVTKQHHYVKTRRFEVIKHILMRCQSLWDSWQSGRFQNQRTRVRICRKDERIEKEAGNGPIFKKNNADHEI